MNVLDLYRESHLSPTHAAGTHGGEWSGPCPSCGGNDRFRIWPEQNNGDGSFWCRGCSKGGDCVTFLIEYRGMKYPEAMKYIGKELAEIPKAVTPKPPRASQEEFVPEEKHGDPAEQWQHKANALVEWACERLMQNSARLAWLKQRGIRKDTARNFRLGLNPGENGKDLFRPRESWGLETLLKDNKQKKRLWIPRGLIIPLMINDQVRRVRIRRFSEKPPRYYVLPGSIMEMIVIGAGSRAVIVVESELDAVLLAQEAGNLAGVIALGSSSARPDTGAFAALRSAHFILNALDYDTAGAKATEWWEKNFPDSVWWPVPVGKDPGEAYQQGVSLYDWVCAGLPAGWSVGPIPGKQVKKEKADEPTKLLLEKYGAADEQEKKGVPEAVSELAEILRQYPVSIVVTKERLTVRESQAWAWNNWKVAKRLSELVFMNQEVFNYLHGRGLEVIDGKNILGGK